MKQQANNMCNSRIYAAFGEHRTLAEWSEDSRCAVNYHCLYARLNSGWEFYKALTTHARATRCEAYGESKGILEWSRDHRCVVQYQTLYKRINSGWNPEDALSTPSMRQRLIVYHSKP